MSRQKTLSGLQDRAVMALAAPQCTFPSTDGRREMRLAASLVTTTAGMAWLSCITADTPCLAGVALPMILIGIGQGCTLSPLTVSGVAEVASEGAGAATGLVNVAHQLGGSLGPGILVVIFTTAGSSILDVRELLAHRVAVSLTAGTAMLAAALAVVFILIVPPSLQPSGNKRGKQDVNFKIVCDSQFPHLFFLSILLPAWWYLCPAALWSKQWSALRSLPSA